jgi:hypothetical protein
MNSLHRQAAKATRSKRLMVLWPIPVGLAAAAAIAATALLGGTAPPAHNGGTSTATGKPGSVDTSSQTAEPRLRIVGAYYTLQRSADGLVKLQITDPAGKLDLAGLQEDLDKAGVPSRVLAGDPGCRPMPMPTATPTSSNGGTATPRASQSAPSRSADDMLVDGQVFGISMEDGKPILAVRPRKIPPGQEIVVGFPHAATDPVDALSVIRGALIASDASYCVPAPPR